jgi:ADP-ribosylglycohydrolase
MDEREAAAAVKPEEVGALTFLLARIFPREIDSRRTVQDSGLTSVELRARFEEPPLSRWFNIILAVPDRAALETLLRRAVAERPDDAGLVEALDRFLRHSAEPLPAQGAIETREPMRVVDPALGQSELAQVRRLIDRRESVAVMRSELERAMTQHVKGPLFLIGDSGVGKTRLAQEGLRIADSLGMTVLNAQCIDRHAEPLLPLRHCLAQYHRTASARNMLAGGSELVDYTPFLDSFLGTTEAAAAASLGGSGGQGVYEGLAQVLLGLTDPAGLCLVVEDLHDADRDTAAFLEYLGREAAATHLVAIVTVTESLLEPEMSDRIARWRAAGCRVNNVPPLAPDDAAEFITLLRDDRPAQRELVGEVLALTGGNPFFIEQVMRLVDEGLGGMVELANVPTRIEAVLMRRLRRLASESQFFLTAAAVALDVTHRVELIAHVARMAVDEASAHLRHAVGQRLLTVDAEGNVGFGQKLLQRVLLEETVPSERTTLNVRAAEWLENKGLFASASHHFNLAGRTADMVRTALSGAEQAEQRGMYATAVQLYLHAMPAGDVTAIGVRLARDHLILGAWSEADAVLTSLPVDLGQARVLRSHLYFVRGSFNRAVRELRLASQDPAVDRIEALIRLADIHLYLGRLRQAMDLAGEALREATEPTDRAQCHAVIGTCLYHLGDVTGAEEAYLKELEALPEEAGRDRLAYTMSLHNLGLAREARGDWEGAKRFHEEALSVRLEVSAAREVGHSLHSVIRSEIALGSFDTARRMLADARSSAIALGEHLELGKLEHTEARIELLTGGDADTAVRRIEEARERFYDLHVSFDVAHATFSLAQAYGQAGAPRRSLEEAASARVQMERGEFGLLTMLFPGLAYWYRDRIEAGLLGYAAGDAVGLPWEGMPPDEIDPSVLPSLHATDEWPAGATSDDTALTLLVAEDLIATGRADAVQFMTRLAASSQSIHGLGPSTTAAINGFRRTGELPAADGNTNGAVMRSLPVGWAVPIDQVRDRRDWVTELSRATHPGAEAKVAACIGAACAAWAIEGASAQMLLEIARDEAAAVVRSHAADPQIVEMLASLAAGTWLPDHTADDMDPYQTVTRALWCIARERTPAGAVLAAVRLGGDTDTVAALVGGLIGCRLQPEEVRTELPWIDEVRLPPSDAIQRLARGIADLRGGGADG